MKLQFLKHKEKLQPTRRVSGSFCVGGFLSFKVSVELTPFRSAMLIKSHIILPRVLTAFERDIALINTTFKTPCPYVDVIAEAQRKITADVYEVRKQFRQRGIKVYEEVADSDGVTARYKCRGYESQMRISGGRERSYDERLGEVPDRGCINRIE